ncbi:MAG: ABC transporter permease [Anaerolineae bacterium]|nr:ABC transporter permease [Anaerolineae bacterium]
MAKYLLRRLASAIPTVIAVIFITFTLNYVSPYDPIKRLLAANPLGSLENDPEAVATLRHQYGLDRPFIVQFADYVGDLARGDMGYSIFGQREIKRMILKTLPISAQLGFAAAVLTALVGVPLGALAAVRQNTWLDYLIVSGTLVLRTIPIYVLAPLTMILFVLILGWFDVPRGWHGLFAKESILPIALLTLGPLPVVVRQTRQSILDIFGQDYIRTAKAKGLRMRMILFRHILPNTLIPVITTMGFITEGMIVGAVFLDSLFAIPGFGAVVSGGIGSFDYPVIMGVTLTSSLLVILTNLLVDMIYPFLDPRVRLG